MSPVFWPTRFRVNKTKYYYFKRTGVILLHILTTPPKSSIKGIIVWLTLKELSFRVTIKHAKRG